MDLLTSTRTFGEGAEAYSSFDVCSAHKLEHQGSVILITDASILVIFHIFGKDKGIQDRTP